MDENENINPQDEGFDPDRPRLKKVKRPKRPFPESGAAAVPPKITDRDFDLDKYLDQSHNMPVKAEPRFINDEDVAKPKTSIPFMENEVFSKKAVIIFSIAAFFVGFFFAKMFFTEQKVVRDGLQGVVINPEVPRGRARCGVAEKTQGCVLYIMNPQRQDLNARDFYDLASQLTGRQRFVIETGNMRYSATKIRPGDIVQLNIPPL